MQKALEAGARHLGATAPNPPVGAVVLDSKGGVLGVGAHELAGSPHAEIRAFEACGDNLALAHTLVVTLEPCNHQGRTPPCVDAILKHGIKRVVAGVRDPNRDVRGGGLERLKKSGVEVIDGVLAERCQELIRGFAHWVRNGIPHVTLKLALDRAGSMIPAPGEKTFTSEASLRLAHELRKRSDAILTGSGTVLADRPEFTVRRVPDHPGKSRWLVVLDRRKRVPADWIEAAQERGFRVKTDLSLEDAIRFLGKKGCHEVLVEAGPELSGEILSAGVWNEKIEIRQGPPGQADTVVVERKD